MRMGSKRVSGMQTRRKRSLAEVDKGEKIEKITPEVIHIPGVKEVSGYLDEQVTVFSMPEAYINRVGDELSNALVRRSAIYDMDDEDEAWLRKFNGGLGNISDEIFELVIDAFEKASFLSPDEVGQVPLPADLCSEDVAKAVYSYWLKKRKRRKSALVRVFEVYKPKKARGRPRKKSRQLGEGEGQHRVAARTALVAVGDGNAVKEEKEMMLGAKEEKEMILAAKAAMTSAARLNDLAVEKRSKAQSLMTKADLLMFKAVMAVRIAQEARIRESLGISAENFLL